MITQSLIVFAVVLGQPTPESLDLPPGIKGWSEWYDDSDRDGNLDNPKQPFCRNYFEIAWEWVRDEQHTYNKTFGGWGIRDFTFDTMDQSLLYHAPNANGTLDRRLNITGHSRIDGQVTPISGLRTLHVRKANGEKIDVRKEGRYTVYSCNRAYNMGRLSVYIDESSKRIDKVVRDGKKRGYASVYEYLEWESLPGGYHHPRRIKASYHNPKDTFWGMTYIRELEVLPADAEPTPFELPERARIIDNIDHVTRNGLMQVIGPIEPDPPSPKTTSTRRGLLAAMTNPRNWFVWGGVGVLLLAAVAWRLKQRGIIA
jgi:hypothetical protein